MVQQHQQEERHIKLAAGGSGADGCVEQRRRENSSAWRFEAVVFSSSIMAAWSFRDAEPGARSLGGLCKVLLFSCLYEPKWEDSHAASQVIESSFIQQALLPCLCGETCVPATPATPATHPSVPTTSNQHVFLHPERCAEMCDTNQPRGSPAERWMRVISGGKIRSN